MQVVVETFLNLGEPSSATRRVRVVAGQGYPSTVRVECSKAMRHAHPLGQKFLLDVKWKVILGATDCLYSNYRDKWYPLTDEEAAAIIGTSGRASKG
jgi:hypothetical protein